MTPVNIILVSDKRDAFAEIEKELMVHQNFTVNHIKTNEQVTKYIQDTKVDVAIVADQLNEQPGFDCIQNIVQLNPFINCALASPLDHDDFHELTEGYGVLMQLSPMATRKEGAELVEKITKIYQLAGETL